jgi:Carboxypeptidase regulatory-like domain
VYEVAGTISERTEAKATKQAGIDVRKAVVLIFALSPFVASVIRPLNHRAPTHAFSSNVGTSHRPEPTENSAAPGYHPRSTPPEARGEIRGTVTYEGTLPKFKPLNMVNEPSCANHYTAPVFPENVVAGPDNALSNVVVYISAGGEEESAPAQPIKLNQRGCRYIPHVLAVATNQEIWVQNDDSVAHTVHPMARINTELNRSQPPGTPPMVIKYDKPEIIRVKCELHPWMRGVFVVLKNPHYSVSDESGGFAMPDLPPGKYTVKAWHEQFGEQSQVVSIGGGETKELHFVFKVTP